MAASGMRRDILIDTAARGDSAATVSIGSISEQDWYISRTHGVYHIPACVKGQPFALLMITARGDALDLGDNRRFPFTITAWQIAEDLLQDLHDHGIFVCEGSRPSDEELASASARWFLSTIDYGRRHDVGPRALRPRNFGFAQTGGDWTGSGARLGVRADAQDEEKAAKHGLGAGAAAARATGLNTGGADAVEKKSRA
jgi:hypothetical protein